MDFGPFLNISNMSNPNDDIGCFPFHRTCKNKYDFAYWLDGRTYPCVPNSKFKSCVNPDNKASRFLPGHTVSSGSSAPHSERETTSIEFISHCVSQPANTIEDKTDPMKSLFAKCQVLILCRKTMINKMPTSLLRRWKLALLVVVISQIGN